VRKQRPLLRFHIHLNRKGSAPLKNGFHETAEPPVSLEQQELDQVENLADRLLMAVGAHKQTPAAAQAIRVRQAAFTLLIRAYGEVRAVVAFLRHKQADADAIAPSLYAGRRTKGKSGEGDQEKPAQSTC
jgi:hypothetical protein